MRPPGPPPGQLALQDWDVQGAPASKSFLFCGLEGSVTGPQGHVTYVWVIMFCSRLSFIHKRCVN